MGDNGGILRQGEKEGRGRMDNKERGRDFRVKIIICNSYSIANASAKDNIIAKRAPDAICNTYKIATKSAKAPFEKFEIPVHYRKSKCQSAIQGNVAMRL
jgi:hypothetical protein